MQQVVANVDHILFDIEKALEQQLGAQPLPFPGMDKSGSAICTFFLNSTCSKGAACPFRHVQGERSVVCKHWLRGLCKKGDFCEFLHEYDMMKMPECYFYSRFGECGNKECPFLHIDPEQRLKVCAWYDRGFCRHGAGCKNRHVRRVMCINYLCGFCLDGPACKFVHPRFDIPYSDSNASQDRKVAVVYTCHFCGETGHKAVSCPKLVPSLKRDQVPSAATGVSVSSDSLPQTHIRPAVRPSFVPGTGRGGWVGGVRHDLRPLEDVTCFKCGEKGHYANKCVKGHLAFLTRSAQAFQQQQQQMRTNAERGTFIPTIHQGSTSAIPRQNNSMSAAPHSGLQSFNQVAPTSS